MLSPRHELAKLFDMAIQSAFGSQYKNLANIHAATRAEFGDYQANFAMMLAKQVGTNPRAVAEQVLQQLPTNDLIAQLEISGPGFINITLADPALQHRLQQILQTNHLMITKTTEPQTVVVDYGGPNVAKEMHVGHLRSTIIGDAIASLLEFLGHHVIRQNHVGDWGTQFGMLVEYLLDEKIDITTTESIADLNAIYQAAKLKFDEDADFNQRARLRVVALQSGDELTLSLWQQLVDRSVQHFQTTYQQLDVRLTADDVCGESFYNSQLAGIVNELQKAKIATVDNGATVVFLDHFVDQNDKPLPFLIKKSDGGYLYATTDLAAAKYRLSTLKADRVIYVTDARQKQHFAMLFACVAKTPWLGNATLEHVPFGAILGKNQKPFKTRSGESIKLADLLQEATQRAAQLAQAKNPDLPPATLQTIAHAVGIGALKYADLSNDKIKDYVFDWDHMLAFDGNTAPYLQNAYVRIKALFRKAQLTPEQLNANNLQITHPSEHLLAVQLLDFSTTLLSISQDLALQRLCTYLYQLAALYHKFYEHCPILSETQAICHSRLLLSELTARTLACGLQLLGIKVIEQM